MDKILLFVSMSLFLFQIVQPASVVHDGITSDLNVSKHYIKSAQDFITQQIPGNNLFEWQDS